MGIDATTWTENYGSITDVMPQNLVDACAQVWQEHLTLEFGHYAPDKFSLRKMVLIGNDDFGGKLLYQTPWVNDQTGHHMVEHFGAGHYLVRVQPGDAYQLLLSVNLTTILNHQLTPAQHLTTI